MGSILRSLWWTGGANGFDVKWAVFGKQNWRCGLNQTWG